MDKETPELNFLKKKDIKKEVEEIRVDWDTYFLGICEAVSLRSLDENTKVGCVVVDWNKRIISTGYNSFPAGVNDDAWPRDRKERQKILKHKSEGSVIFIKNYDPTDEYMVTNFNIIGEVDKYDIIAHAEENAIASHKGSLKNCTMYCTYLPCNICARLIITAGIKKVIYKIENERYLKSCAIAKELFKEAKIELVKYEPPKLE